MPSINIVKQSKTTNSVRVKQLSAMFDVPLTEAQRLEWKGELPIEAEPWSVGLIVGPSGSGKTTIARELFGEPIAFDWSAGAVIDDFDKRHPIADIAAICQAVGFNTIPAWMRPFGVLSNGEQFRVMMARAMLEAPEGKPILVDEFTSVVDRQVAQIGAHAVQKHIRRTGKQFVAVSCHYDIIDWLQPDWIFEPHTMQLTRRSVRSRPSLECEITRCDHKAWKLFAPFHYLTADLNTSARCYVLLVGGKPASFAGVLYRPHPKVKNVYGVSRLVTLPDWQGLGLAMILADFLGSVYKALDRRFHTYPAHPALIKSFDKSNTWALEHKPGRHMAVQGKTSTISLGTQKGRPCAVFSYQGPVFGDASKAAELIGA